MATRYQYETSPRKLEPDIRREKKRQLTQQKNW